MLIKIRERSVHGYIVNSVHNKYSVSGHYNYITMDLNYIPNVKAAISFSNVLVRRIVYIMRGLGNEKLHNM